MSRISSKSAEASYIEQLDIVSNEDQGRKVSVLGGVVELQYYESILDDGIRATVKFADAGNTIDNKTARDGLPIDGQETVNLKFRDNNEQTLKLTLYVKKVTPLSDKTTKSLIHLDLSSREIFMNDKVRLNTRFDGKISEHIREIFTNQNYLGISKDIEIEETSNNFNFCGNNMKPYYTMNWLSKKAVSAENQTLGVSAGYFFFETSEGYKFKSIDGLLSQEKKKSIIYNETPDTRGQNIPAGYDIKALDYTFDNKVNVEDKLKMGAYSTRTILFDPFNCFYQVINPVARDTEGSLKLGGKRLPTPNPEFNRSGKNKEFSRTQYMLIDKGTIPTGRTQQQVEKSKEQNFDPERILNQSSMRYNQLFASKCTITIAGDFSLHAGDVVFFDAPDAQTDTKNDDVNKETGGLYIIADLCHYITPKETYTKLNLVRDSFGRKGNHTSNSALR
jgi:hypothetical protein